MTFITTSSSIDIAEGDLPRYPRLSNTPIAGVGRGTPTGVVGGLDKRFSTSPPFFSLHVPRAGPAPESTPLVRCLQDHPNMAAVATGVLRRLLKPSGSWTTAFSLKACAAAGRHLTAAAATSGRKCATPYYSRLPFSTSSSRFVPAVTQHAPYFKGTAVVDGDFKELSLDDFKGKYLVLFFYPLDFTFVCPTEIVAFSDKANEFHDVNCEVIGVSVDSHFCHHAWINTPRKNGGLGPMNIPLLSDITKQISRDYGVLLEASGLALRGLFIIDPNGIIKHLSINDLPVGRSVEETLRLVKAFQFVETHGEVCPANWTPNSPTIKPNPEGSKEYFAKVNK